MNIFLRLLIFCLILLGLSVPSYAVSFESIYGDKFKCGGTLKVKKTTWKLNLTFTKDVLGYNYKGTLIGKKGKNKSKYKVSGVFADIANNAYGTVSKKIKLKKAKKGKKFKVKAFNMTGGFAEIFPFFMFKVSRSNPNKPPLEVGCVIGGDPKDKLDSYPTPTPTPTPMPAVSVWGVDAGPNLIIAAETDFNWRTPYSFKNGGMDMTSTVTYHELLGPYSNYPDAYMAFCDLVKKKIHWKMAGPCQVRYELKIDKFYWGCESSIYKAIEHCCPINKYSWCPSNLLN